MAKHPTRVSIAEAAALLGVSGNTIRRWFARRTDGHGRPLLSRSLHRGRARVTIPIAALKDALGGAESLDPELREIQQKLEAIQRVQIETVKAIAELRRRAPLTRGRE